MFATYGFLGMNNIAHWLCISVPATASGLVYMILPASVFSVCFQHHRGTNFCHFPLVLRSPGGYIGLSDHGTSCCQHILAHKQSMYNKQQCFCLYAYLTAYVLRVKDQDILSM